MNFVQYVDKCLDGDLGAWLEDKISYLPRAFAITARITIVLVVAVTFIPYKLTMWLLVPERKQ
jgi:hypothetical protein